MRTLALDHGERRIGVAISDPTGTLAQPLETITARGAEAAIERVAAIVAEHEVSRIVVGLPLHMDGQPGPQAEAARAFGARVAKRTGLPVDYLDERWTTQEAQRVLEQQGGRGRRGERGRADRVAAAILLRTYLERTRP